MLIVKEIRASRMNKQFVASWPVEQRKFPSLENGLLGSDSRHSSMVLFMYTLCKLAKEVDPFCEQRMICSQLRSGRFGGQGRKRRGSADSWRQGTKCQKVRRAAYGTM